MDTIHYKIKSLMNWKAEHDDNKKLKVQHIARNKNKLYFCRP